MITFTAVLLEKKEVAPSVFFLTFACEKNQTINFKAGQYVVVSVPEGSTTVKRLYSIATSANTQTQFGLLIKRVENGVGSGYLTGLSVGESAQMTGPAGLFSIQDSPLHKIFLATGTGIAPILSFLTTYNALSGSLFWGLQTKNDVFFTDLFVDLRRKNPLFDFRICLSREQILPAADYLYGGRVNFGLNSYMAKRGWSLVEDRFEYYVCGSRNVVEALKNDLLARGVKKERLFFEKY